MYNMLANGLEKDYFKTVFPTLYNYVVVFKINKMVISSSFSVVKGNIFVNMLLF